MKLPITGAQALDLRKKLGLNQTDFWKRVNTHQSGGCRYESGRGIPKPVQTCILIAYGTEAESAKQVAALRSTKAAKK